MNESDKNFDDQLAVHFSEQKRHFKAPADIKKQVLQKAKRIDKEMTPNTSLNWFAPGALAASLIVLGFIVFMPQSINRTSLVAQNDFIELHTLEPSRKSNSSALAYATLEQEYAQKQMLTAVIRKPARLEINDDGTWALETCEDEAIQISKQLVSMLEKYDVMETSFDSGMMVAISFNSDGHITRIDQHENPKIC